VIARVETFEFVHDKYEVLRKRTNQMETRIYFMKRREPYILYEVKLRSLVLEIDRGVKFDATHLLANGRANYILFENLIAECAGLNPNSQGGASDLCDDSGSGYEVKSYKDAEKFPDRRNDRFHTGASSTFGANNHGPTIKLLLQEGKYSEALRICRESGFDKNDFYVYVNSAQYDVSIPLRYVILPTSDVLSMISREDPRLISRSDILAKVKRTEAI